jgi:hypothetical protein
MTYRTPGSMDAVELQTEINSLKREVGQLKSYLEVANQRIQDLVSNKTKLAVERKSHKEIKVLKFSDDTDRFGDDRMNPLAKPEPKSWSFIISDHMKYGWEVVEFCFEKDLVVLQRQLEEVTEQKR